MPWYGYLIQWVVTVVVIPWAVYITLGFWKLRTRVVALETWQRSFEHQCEKRYQWLQEMSDDIKKVLQGQARLEGKLEGPTGKVRT